MLVAVGERARALPGGHAISHVGKCKARPGSTPALGTSLKPKP
jgi:hypothetical protein